MSIETIARSHATGRAACRARGEERMLLAAEAGSACKADDILRRVFAAADQFTGTASQHDDMTLVVLKIQ